MRPQPDLQQLTPYECAFILMDYQVQFVLAPPLENARAVIQNAAHLAKVAMTFSIPTVLTTAGASSFGGPLLSKLQGVFSIQPPVDRNTINPWNDDRVLTALEEIGRKKLVVAGLWTDFGVSVFVLQALRTGYEVILVEDACGDMNERTHRMAIQRMRREGAITITWFQLFLMFHRQLSSPDDYRMLSGIVSEHASLYGPDKHDAVAFQEKKGIGLTNDKMKERGWTKWPRLQMRLQKSSQKET